MNTFAVGMQNRWVILFQPPEEQVKKLSQELSFPYSITSLLIQKGIDTFDKVRDFFKPSLESLHNPFLMKDMDKAVQRIILAIENKEKILIYGDYDVDGTTSVSMMYLFISSICTEVGFYIPDRYQEGYGISYQGIDYALENNFSLIISLDCGIKENKKVTYAKNKNIDFIICDHHLPDNDIPNAYAVLDPLRPDCDYPYKYLSGCGVGFKLIQALGEELNLDQDKIISYLDFVAVSIAADIVPITGENRILTSFGLKRLIENPRIGLKFFLTQETKESLSANDIVFGFAPKINAAGRVKHAYYAVNLLISTNEIEARKLFSELNEFNRERRELDLATTTEAIQEIKKTGQTKNYSTIVFNKNWHKGVIGIVASRLVEEYYRPALVFTEGKDKNLVGSARSVTGFDVYKAIEICSEYLEQFGGHMAAAGLVLKKDNFIPFKEKFEAVVKESITESQQIAAIEISQELKLSDINKRLFSLIKYFEPFGPNNMRPVFLAKNVCYGGNHALMGKNKSHLKLMVFQNDIKNSFETIAFKMGHLLPKFETYPFDMVFTLFENYWQGKTFYQLQIRDVNFLEN